MKDLKKKSVSILCNLGKFGVGKSLTLGMYDVPIPKEMKRTSEINTTRNCEKSLTQISFQDTVDKISINP